MILIYWLLTITWVENGKALNRFQVYITQIFKRNAYLNWFEILLPYTQFNAFNAIKFQRFSLLKATIKGRYLVKELNFEDIWLDSYLIIHTTRSKRKNTTKLLGDLKILLWLFTKLYSIILSESVPTSGWLLQIKTCIWIVYKCI